jgi:hypothetical protein
MKRRITVEQLNELTAEQKDHLREQWIPEKGDWCIDKESYVFLITYYSDDLLCHADGIFIGKRSDCLPLLDIGQMIELLAYKGIEVLKGEELNVNSHEGDMQNYLCDMLWNIVKAVL